MKPAALRAMSTDQLTLTLKDTVRNLFHLRLQSATDRLETPSEISKARRDIARIKTILTERESGKSKQRVVMAVTCQPNRRLTRRQRKRLGRLAYRRSVHLSYLMSTIVETTRRKLLDALDPSGVYRETVGQWVENRVKRGEEFSLEDAVLALKGDVPTGSVSLSLAELVSNGVLQELLYAEVDGMRQGKPMTPFELSKAPTAPRTDRQMIVPWYRKK